ncbi:hypothetical protein HYS95_02645 [Candidatus Daviesbacteria bacterium]|nr:hypothetical protein [Candidatus Daviesbacteria bacterium]
MIEQLERLNNAEVKPLNKGGFIAEVLVEKLGVPADKTSEWLDALYAAFGGENREQRVIDYLRFKVEMGKIK